jgi:hypothetical protein
VLGSESCLGWTPDKRTKAPALKALSLMDEGVVIAGFGELRGVKH